MCILRASSLHKSDKHCKTVFCLNEFFLTKLRTASCQNKIRYDCIPLFLKTRVEYFCATN